MTGTLNNKPRRWRKVLVVMGTCTLIALVFETLWRFSQPGRATERSFVETLGPDLIYWYSWGGVFPVVVWLARRFPIPSPRAYRRLGIHFLFGLLFSLLTLVFYFLEHTFLQIVAYVKTGELRILTPEFQGWLDYFLAGSFSTGFVIYGLIVAMVHARSYFSRYRQEELKNLRLKSQLMEAELQALKMQLHPHFFFNTLNTISSLLQSDIQAADSMLARLGDFLRLTLDNTHRTTVSLGEEFQFVRKYLEIEQARFKDRLTVKIEADPTALEAAVPNLILQPLIENAVRHGVSKRIAPGFIHVRAQQSNGTLEIQLHNTGPALPTHLKPEAFFDQGIGLANTKARLDQLYSTNYRLELANREEGVVVTLCLPFEPYSPLPETS